MFTVYLITNIINGKRYVGQTSGSLQKRLTKHSISSSGCLALRNAIFKYGKKNFLIEEIVQVPVKQLANEFEIEYIKRYCSMSPNGYNLTKGGEGCKGYKRSFETRKRISEKLKGNKNAKASVRTVEMRQRASETAKKNMSQEQRQVLREARLRQPCPRTGKKHSEEAKLKMSAAHKKWWSLDGIRQKMSDAHKKRP